MCPRTRLSYQFHKNVKNYKYFIKNYPAFKQSCEENTYRYILFRIQKALKLKDLLKNRTLKIYCGWKVIKRSTRIFYKSNTQYRC